MTMQNPALFVSTIANALGTSDAQSRRQRQRESEHFARVRNAYFGYAGKLRRVARHVQDIIRAYPPGDPAGVEAINRYLRDYSNLLRPWAQATGALMLAEVSRRDYFAWVRHARTLNQELDKELLRGGSLTGDEMRRLIDEQVELITSIPLEAAQKVQDLSQAYWVAGQRYGALRTNIIESDYLKDFSQIPQQVYNRATLIARTEVSKTSSAVTQSRARYIGSTHYVWKTARDKDVRLMHKKLEGTVHAWDDPPVAEENGERHHPGNFPNCRCFSAPILPAPEDIGR
jgi:SPP1 gp7 family putative phage head morphogenesis protein